MADSKLKTQIFVVISNCGFPGEHNFEGMKAAFACCNPSLEIYRSCGKLLASRNEKIQAIVAEYLSYAEQNGYELAVQGDVSEKAVQSLEMQLLPVQDYVKYLGM